ncbi:MAG: hypothetical protein KF758_11000 [Anaerolineales bacterium]|nr:hypothetical protein [Anaerolineales bacterium]
MRINKLVQIGNVYGNVIVDKYPEKYLSPKPSRDLIGREKILKEILGSVRSGHNTLLYGMPGIGKTLICQHIAVRLEKEVDGGILWIKVGNESLDTVATKILEHLGYSSLRVGKKDYFSSSAIRAMLGQKKRIIVLDDLYSEELAQAVIENYVPSNGNVIATSRYDISCFPKKYLVDSLGIKDSSNLLYSGWFKPNQKISQEDGKAGRDIVKALGGHPFAIVLATDSAKRIGISLRDLAKSLNKNYVKLKDSSEATKQITSKIFEILQILWDAIDEPPRFILSVIAHLNSPSISQALLYQIFGQINFDFNEGFEILTKSGLVFLNENWEMHDLTKQFIQQKSPVDDIQAYKLLARSIIFFLENDKFDEIFHTDQETILQVMDWILLTERDDLAELVISRASEDFFNTLIQSGNSETAIQILTYFLSHNENNLLCLKSMINLGVIRIYNGSFDEAIISLNDAVSLSESLGEPTFKLKSTSNLAVCYLLKNDYEKAQAISDEIIKSSNSTDKSLLLSFQNAQLGIINIELNEINKGITYLEDALSDSQDIADRGYILSWLGKAHLLKGEIDASIQYAEKSLNIAKKTSDAWAQCNRLQLLAQIQSDKQNYKKAKSLADKALKVSIALKNSFAKAKSLEILGNIAKATGDLTRAKSYYITANEITTNFKDKIILLNNLAIIEITTGVIINAIDHWDFAWSLMDKTDINDSQYVVKKLIAYNYALALHNNNQTDDCLDVLNRIASIDKPINNTEAQILLLKAKALQKNKEFDIAVELYKKCANYYKENNDQENKNRILVDIASVQLEKGESDEALNYFLQALE